MVLERIKITTLDPSFLFSEKLCSWQDNIIIFVCTNFFPLSQSRLFCKDEFIFYLYANMKENIITRSESVNDTNLGLNPYKTCHFNNLSKIYIHISVSFVSAKIEMQN